MTEQPPVYESEECLDEQLLVNAKLMLDEWHKHNDVITIKEINSGKINIYDLTEQQVDMAVIHSLLNDDTKT